VACAAMPKLNNKAAANIIIFFMSVTDATDLFQDAEKYFP
jgi:hypothetical protein